jgi:hypothetical protein
MVTTLLATRQNAKISFIDSASTFRALEAHADDGIDVQQDITSTTGGVVLNGDTDNANDGLSRDHISFVADVTITSALDIDLYARNGGIKLAGPLTLNAARYIYIHDRFEGPYGEHAVVINGDSDNDFVGGVSVASRVCSYYSDSASCSASRLCGWCSYEPRTVARGVISTSDATGTAVSGLDTILTKDVVVGGMVIVDGQARVITGIHNDTHATVNQKFTKVATGMISVYADSLDKIIGSQSTQFDQELQAGYKIMASGLTQTISLVSTHQTLTCETALTVTAENVPFTIGNVVGSGKITATALSTQIMGSWPPETSKFQTELKSGYIVTVNNISRTVEAIIDHHHFTVTEAFPMSFDSVEYIISNIPGTGVVSFNAGSHVVTGTDMVSSAFTSEIKVGDLITADGQTKMIQSVTNDFEASVSSKFTSNFGPSNFTVENVHSSPFTVAKQGTGTVSTSGTTVQGLGTIFGLELEIGQTVIVPVGATDSFTYESRTIASISRDDMLEVDQEFSTTSNAPFYYQTCPSQTAGLEEEDAGTFTLHAKSPRLKTCYNNGRCVPQASHLDVVETVGAGFVHSLAGSTIINGIDGTDFVNEVRIGNTISLYGLMKDQDGFEAYRQETQIVQEVVSSTILRTASAFSFTVPARSNQQFIIRNLAGRGAITSTGGTSTTVYGSGTQFVRDLSVGFAVFVGNQLRVITSITSETVMNLNAPLNSQGGGVANSAWSFESCLSGVGYTNTFNSDYTVLEPGCCGVKVLGSVASNNYAYYKLTPTHSNYDVRFVVSSSSNLLDLVIRYGVAPDAVTYDFKAIGDTSPWQLEIPQNMLVCSNNTACQSVFVGVKGLPGSLNEIDFEVAAYVEFNYRRLICIHVAGDNLAQAMGIDDNSECSAVSLSHVGNATVTHDSADANNAVALRLTSATAPGTKGAVWYNNKVHLQNGFETTFSFKLASVCDSAESPDCVAGDGFAFVIQSNSVNSIGCNGSGLGFGNVEYQNCDEGIPYSFAIEFDTWHNPELHDINLRGVGLTHLNASATPRFNFVHAAFFSQGEASNTVDHSQQLAGTPAIPPITDGEIHTARVVYIPGTSSSSPGRIFLYIDDLQSFVLTSPLRLTSAGNCGTGTSDKCILDPFGNAYLGFTSAAGEVGQTVDVTAWSFCDDPNCGKHT